MKRFALFLVVNILILPNLMGMEIDKDDVTHISARLVIEHDTDLEQSDLAININKNSRLSQEDLKTQENIFLSKCNRYFVVPSLFISGLAFGMILENWIDEYKSAGCTRGGIYFLSGIFYTMTTGSLIYYHQYINGRITPQRP